MRTLSIGYHEVRDDDGSALPPGVFLHSLDRATFRRHLEAIRERRQNAVETIAQLRVFSERIPLFLTFDDGRAGAYSCVAEELERCGWRGHFFITTDWIGRRGFLTGDQIRELHARGHVVGSHSCSHPPRMSKLTLGELRKEWTESCSRLNDILGARVAVASVPDGYYLPNVARTAAASGIEALFTSEPTSAVMVVDGCLVLGRYTIQLRTPPSVSGRIAAGEVWPRWQQTASWQAKKIVKMLLGTYYLSLRQYVLERRFSQ